MVERKEPPTDAAPEPVEDADRDAILARRKVFVAAALASLAGAAACRDPFPGPCLSAKPIPNDASEANETEPQPCLKVPVRPLGVREDAGASEAAAAGSDGSAPPKPVPHPCLSPVVVPRDAAAPQPCLSQISVPPPTPCLSVVAPRVDAGPPATKKD